MDFQPKSIFKGRDSKGSSYRMEEWDYNTLAGPELTSIFMNLVMGVFIGWLLSPIFAIFTILSFNGRTSILNILGIFVGGYFLYDCYHGWLCLALTKIFLSEAIINFLVIVNIITLVVHFVLLFSTLIHKLIVKNFTEEESRVKVFLALIVIVITIAYFSTYDMMKDKKGWVQHKVDIRNREIINN